MRFIDGLPVFKFGRKKKQEQVKKIFKESNDRPIKETQCSLKNIDKLYKVEPKETHRLPKLNEFEKKDYIKLKISREEVIKAFEDVIFINNHLIWLMTAFGFNTYGIVKHRSFSNVKINPEAEDRMGRIFDKLNNMFGNGELRPFPDFQLYGSRFYTSSRQFFEHMLKLHLYQIKILGKMLACENLKDNIYILSELRELNSLFDTRPLFLTDELDNFKCYSVILPELLNYYKCSDSLSAKTITTAFLRGL